MSVRTGHPQPRGLYHGIPAKNRVRLFSYVVARDFGFAPNPFGGTLTLATCKPRIRQAGLVGDWVVGLTSKEDSPQPRIVFAMNIDEVLTFQEYWADQRYQYKKPLRPGSLKQALGDNIYHQDLHGGWLQCDSHHSHEDGSPNPRNIQTDTQSHRVLASRRFAYWGSAAPLVPHKFLHWDGQTLQIGRNHRSNFSPDFVSAFVQWFNALDVQGYLAPPFRWARPRAIWARSPN